MSDTSAGVSSTSPHVGAGRLDVVVMAGLLSGPSCDGDTEAFGSARRRTGGLPRTCGHDHPSGWQAARRGAVRRQRRPGVRPDLLGEARAGASTRPCSPSRSTRRRTQRVSGVRSRATSSPSSPRLHRLARVVLGDPVRRPGAAPARPSSSSGRGLEHALRQVARLGVGRRLGRQVEQRRRRRPGRGGTAAPPRPGGTRPPGRAGPRRSARRIGSTSRSVVSSRRGDVVAQVQPPALAQRLLDDRAARAPRPPRPPRRGRPDRAASPATRSTLASARSSASRSTRPGVSASARSATTSASASSTVSRSGRVTPAGSSRVIVSPSNSTSMRSPGPWPGSPHTQSRSRSLRSRSSVTPKTAAASLTRTPGRASR